VSLASTRMTEFLTSTSHGGTRNRTSGRCGSRTPGLSSRGRWPSGRGGATRSPLKWRWGRAGRRLGSVSAGR
jgi:hypothetical protein